MRPCLSRAVVLKPRMQSHLPLSGSAWVPVGWALEGTTSTEAMRCSSVGYSAVAKKGTAWSKIQG